MTELEKARLKIDEIDQQMALLFEKRMDCVKEVSSYKKSHGLEITDSQREDEVIKKHLEEIRNPEYKSYYRSFLKSVMEVSKKFQGEEHIVIERNSLPKASSYFDLNRKVLVVTDSNIPTAYAQTLLSQCKEGYLHITKGGEDNKSFESVQAILKDLLNHDFTRKDCVVALGGGIVGDMAGFAASIYMRGIDLYMVPTTVLSQVDSSVGGKTAVNFEGIKNPVGSFYQSRAVLIDPTVLETLDEKQITNGLAEALKMALCLDSELFEVFLNDNPRKRMDEIIRRSIELKMSVVEEDEKESGIRKVLNFGHTIGHGLECTQEQGGLLHGQCVALGMRAMCTDSVREALDKCLEKLGLPKYCNFKVEEVLNAIRHDKKASGQTIKAVFVSEVGKFEFVDMTIGDIKERLEIIRQGSKA